MKQNIFVVFLVVILCVSSFSQTNEYHKENELELAYRKDSDSLKAEFFRKWIAQSDSFMNIDKKYTDTEKEIIRVYESAFKPKKKFRCILNSTKVDSSIKNRLLKDLKSDKTLHLDANFLYINPLIDYYIENDSDFNTSKPSLSVPKRYDSSNSISYPKLSIKHCGKYLVFILDAYEKELEEYLDFKIDYSNKVLHKKSLEEMGKRKKFIESNVDLYPVHDLWKWRYASCPKIRYILINKSQTKARVHYNSEYDTHCISKFEKIDNAWQEIPYDGNCDGY
jgi:hypothetical protein